jgi:Cap4 SAVED domain
MSAYDLKPERFLALIYPAGLVPGSDHTFCAGFELSEWRCQGFADHLIEWLPDYALSEDLLKAMNHANAYTRLRQAAQRVYTTQNFERRGEIGEIAAHCISRDFFGTIPISPRVYYKSSSNDVVKGFDLVHVRFVVPSGIEIWLGEAKIYKSRSEAIYEALRSVRGHIDAGFLTSHKLLLGRQIPEGTPHRERIVRLFEPNTSIDELVASAVFPIFILGESEAIVGVERQSDAYTDAVVQELEKLVAAIEESEIKTRVRVPLFYIPLLSKKALVDAFDQRLKGLQ